MQQEQVLDGRYRLAERLGAGGMSVVWQAHDELLNRPVAIKVLAGREATEPAARLRIRAEAQAAAQLWHPNVTNVYDYGEAVSGSGTCVPYVVMELLPGRTLSERLADGPLPPRAALRICAEVASALAAAHRRGLVHRDVKPSNVMLTPSGAKVLDFGLAAVVGQMEIDDDGELRGTPAYLAPERLIGGEVIPASDVYALGLLIHRSLTTHLPWQADTTTQMLNAHVYVEPQPLPATDGVAPEVNQICERCLAKDPADRPSAGEVAAVLADAAGIVLMPQDDPAPVSAAGEPGREPAGRPPAAAPVTGRGRPRRRPAVLLAGLVAAVVAATVSIALGVALDREDAQPAADIAAADPGLPTPGSATSAPAPEATSAPPAPVRAVTPTPTARRVAPAAPAPAASPSSRTPAPTSPAARPTTTPPGAPVTANGAVARVRCDDKKAQILQLDVAAGYTLDEYKPGPDDEVKAVLISATHRSEIKVRCDHGAVAAQTKESPL